MAQAPAPIIQCTQRDKKVNNISWFNPLASCGTYIKTYIYFSNSKSGPYQLLDSSVVNTYTHVGINESATYYYYLVSKYACTSSLSGTSDTFEDTRLPAPELVSISIENNHPVYQWLSPNRREIWGYPIVLSSSILDTVMGRDQTGYIDMTADVTQGPYEGAVAAMDSCGTINGRSGYLYQKTSFLSLLNNPCNGTLNLSWTNYKGWNSKDDVGGWEVLITKNQNPETSVASLDPSVRAYIYSDFKYGDTIAVRVRGIHPSNPAIFSHTNSYVVISKKTVKPILFHALSASYLNNYQVKILFYLDQDSRPKGFNIQRRDLYYNQLLKSIKSVPYTHIGGGYYYVIDNEGSANEPVNYIVEMEDSCNNLYPSYPVATTSIQVTQTGLYRNSIDWNTRLFPDSILYSMDNRELQFSTDGSNFYAINGFSSANSPYVHELENYQHTNGNFCYRMRTTYHLDTTQPILSVEREEYSQVQCVALRTVMWVPTAFKVNGATPVFKPLLVFFTSSDFKMQIFNRWGIQVYETRDVNLGWNGRMSNGNDAPEDDYMYIIEYTGNDGVKVSKSGNFILLR